MNRSKQHIIQTLAHPGLVPLLSHEHADEAVEIIEAVYQGGLRAFEFTNRKANSLEVFQHILKHRSRYPDMLLGVGTIMDDATTHTYINAGADFIISPIVKTSMATVCQEHDVMWIPGCATLTEIVTARDHGAAVMKVFPGSVLGPGFISSIMPVVPNLKLMVTGGVEPTEQNLSAWFKAGAMCVGLGSQLFTRDILQQKQWTLLTERVREVIALAHRIRS